VTNNSFYDSKCDVFSFAIIMFEFLTLNFEPYGKSTYMIEVKVAKNPLFRPGYDCSFEFNSVTESSNVCAADA